MIIVDTTNITLYNITCTNSAPSFSELFYNISNSSLDSLSYCNKPRQSGEAGNTVCGNMSDSFNLGISFFGIIITIGAMVVIIFLVMLMVSSLSDSNSESSYEGGGSSGGNGIAIFLSIVGVLFVIGLIVFIFALIFGALCSL